ncbi:MAG TPA: biotin/lipoyl-binding protein [Thermoanaerobaculales bacterium]|nr:biotin/lipoyl-binding protein [Thermoanaerobaculales bacterium]
MKWVVRGASGAHEVVVERSADGLEVTLDGRRHAVDLIRLDGAVASLRFDEDGRSFHVSYDRGRGRDWRIGIGDRDFTFDVLTPVEAIGAMAAATGRGASVVAAPIPGKVVAVTVEPGDEVEPGRPLVVLEAMKMENELTAEVAGRVAAVRVAPGDTVEAGAVLVELEEGPVQSRI